MKIIITHEFPFEKKYFGGGNQIVKGMSNMLAENGHLVDILTSGSDEFDLNKSSSNSINYHFLTNYSKYSFLIFYFKILIKILQKRPDSVICFTSESLPVTFFCKVLKIDCCLYQAAPEFPIFSFYNKLGLKNIRYKFGIYFQFLATKISDRVYTISNYSSNMIINNWHVNNSKIITLGLGLDNVFFELLSNVQIKKFNSGLYKILSFGRITFDQKPFNRLPKPLSELGKYWNSWTIVGNGPDYNELKQLVTQNNIDGKTFFVGGLDTGEVIKFLNSSDIVVLPSNYESFFITAYESVMLQKIVITDDVADIKQNLSKFSNVIIVDTSDANLLKNTLLDVFENYDLFIKDVEIASSYVKKNFCWETVYCKMHYFKNDFFTH